MLLPRTRACLLYLAVNEEGQPPVSRPPPPPLGPTPHPSPTTLLPLLVSTGGYTHAPSTGSHSHGLVPRFPCANGSCTWPHVFLLPVHVFPATITPQVFLYRPCAAQGKLVAVTTAHTERAHGACAGTRGVTTNEHVPRNGAKQAGEAAMAHPRQPPQYSTVQPLVYHLH